MAPQRAPVTVLVELGNAHTVAVGSLFFGHDVHCHFGQIHICAYSRRGRDARSGEHVAYHGHGQSVCRHAVHFQISRSVDKHLVDRIDVDVFRSYIFQIHFVDARAVIDVKRHARRRHYIVHGKILTLGQQAARDRFPHTPPPAVGLAHLLHHLKQSRPASYSESFKRWRHGQAYRLFRAAYVGHHQIRVERIEAAFHTFHRCVKRFEVNGYVYPCSVHDKRPIFPY